MAELSLSIVIPVLNEGRTLSRSLEELQVWRSPQVCELVLVDGGSDDGSIELARPRVDKLLHAARGRARQMNAGAAQVNADWLLFLHGDTRLQISLAELLEKLPVTPGWGFFRVRLSGAGFGFRIIERAMNLRSGLTAVSTGDQGLLIHRELFQKTGGFAEIPLMEDVEYCKRLRKLARPLRLAPAVITSSRRWEEQGILRTMVRMWYLRFAYWLGVAPERLARHYYG
jgi:rSAM/selenodomain-associated transferase 2